MKNLKKDFLFIGYARKSVGHAVHRDKNIQMMVNNLYNRCKVDKCYVSYSTEASSSIESRDVKDGVEILAKLKNIHGNTQGIVCVYFPCKFKSTKYVIFVDMINVVSSTSQKICLVVIDYSGLCTNHSNIFQFVR